MAYTPEIVPLGIDAARLNNERMRSTIASTLGSIGQVVVGTGDNLTEDLKADNAFLMLAGKHEGLYLKVAGTAVSGQPGAILTRLVTLAGTPQYMNTLQFLGTDGSTNVTRLVDIINTAGVYRFLGCRFTKGRNQGAEHVRVANGARVIFDTCIFDGVASAVGNVINVVSGNPANVACIACVNLTTNIYGTITNIGSI